MVMTASNMLDLGSKAPDFSLPDTVSGNTLSLQDMKSDKATVIMFICNHCPFVIHVQQALANLGTDYQSKGVSFIAISSNDVENYPADAPDKMTLFAKEQGFSFPYLYDESQDVAKAYQAACTPDFFVFDSELECVYRGQIDESRPGNDIPVTGNDMRAALDALLAGEAINPEQKPSMGCNIKWKD